MLNKNNKNLAWALGMLENDMINLIEIIKNKFGVFEQKIPVPKIVYKEFEKKAVTKFIEEIEIKNNLAFSFSLSQNKIIK